MPYQNTSSNNPGFSSTFAQLCADGEGEEDIIGLLAYALYKKSKQEWASSKVRSIEDAERYAEFHLTPTNVDSMRRSAEEMLGRMALSIEEDARPRIEQESFGKGFKQLEERISNHVTKRTAFWNGVGVNLFDWGITIGMTAFALAGFFLPNLAEHMAQEFTKKQSIAHEAPMQNHLAYER